MKNNRLTILNIFLTILSCGLLLRQPTPGTEFQFASLELPQVSISGAGELTEPVFIQKTGGPPSVHSGTLAELKDQTLLAAWFGGSREGARDVQIFLSRLSKKGGHWTPPEVIVNFPRSCWRGVGVNVAAVTLPQPLIWYAFCVRQNGRRLCRGATCEGIA